MESAVDPLEKLRDIHLPLDPNWWPPAPGWWIILCLFMVIVVFLVRACVSAHRRRQAGLIAIKSLNEIEQGYKHNRNTQDTIRQLSVLLRRHALAGTIKNLLRVLAVMHGFNIWIKKVMGKNLVREWGIV